MNLLGVLHLLSHHCLLETKRAGTAWSFAHLSPTHSAAALQSPPQKRKPQLISLLPWPHILDLRLLSLTDVISIFSRGVQLEFSFSHVFCQSCLLSEAAVGGNLSVVLYLLEKGSRHTKRKSFTPLHCAALYGHLDIVKYLMESSYAKAMYSSFHDNTPLYCANEKGHFNVVKYLIEQKGCDPYTSIDKRGDTLLHIAATFGHLEIVEYLICTTNLDLLKIDDHQDTPLSLAAMRGHVEVFRFLISQLKLKYNPRALCDELTHSDGNKLVHVAAEHGHLLIFKYLVEELKCDPYTSNDKGDKPIHCAAIHGHLNVVKYLVEEVKCDPMLPGRKSLYITPIHFAATNDCLDVTKYLVEERNCDAASKRVRDITPLHDAAIEGHLDIV